METVLELRGICKDFPGVRVLAGVDLDFRAGEIHGLAIARADGPRSL